MIITLGLFFGLKIGFILQLIYLNRIEFKAKAASLPLFFLTKACLRLKQVKIQFPTGFLLSILMFIIASITDFDIKSKWAVLPLITHPIAINPSNFFIFLEIITGISKTPGTLIIFKSVFLLRNFLVLFNKASLISL